MMRIREVIAKLLEYNQEATFEVIANNRSQKFSFVCGNSDGCTKVNCSTAGLYLDETCQNEQQ